MLIFMSKFFFLLDATHQWIGEVKIIELYLQMIKVKNPSLKLKYYTKASIQQTRNKKFTSC